MDYDVPTHLTRQLNEDSTVILNKIKARAEGDFVILNPPFVSLFVKKNEPIPGVKTLSLIHFGKVDGKKVEDPMVELVEKDSKFYPILFKREILGINSGNLFLPHNLGKYLGVLDFLEITWLSTLEVRGFLDEKSRIMYAE